MASREKITHCYKITNTINGKIYIGATIQNPPTRRWTDHKKSALKNNDCKALYNSIRKYGVENFKFEVISCCKSISDMYETEKILIAQYNSYIHSNNSNGYNLTLGGDGSCGSKWSEDQCNKRRGKNHHNFGKSVNRGKNNGMYGKYGESHPMYGKRHSMKSKQKMSKAKIGKSSGRLGIPVSEEVKLKISNTLTGRKRTVVRNIPRNKLGSFYKIYKLNGEMVVIKNLELWCETNPYSSSRIRKFLAGTIDKYKDIIKVEKMKNG